MENTQTLIIRACTKCGNDTGTSWKSLCRSCWDNRTPDEIRAYRQAKLDKKVARLRKKAERLKEEADAKQAAFNRHRGDIAFLTQPAPKNSPFGRQVQKILDRYEKGIQLNREAQQTQEKAEGIEKRGAVVKGDAERKRQQERDARDKVFTIGSKVYDWCFGEGEIIRVNKKTYTIKFTSGGTYARDKSYIKL